jgi:hypothetical protein
LQTLGRRSSQERNADLGGGTGLHHVPLEHGEKQIISVSSKKNVKKYEGMPLDKIYYNIIYC